MLKSLADIMFLPVWNVFSSTAQVDTLLNSPKESQPAALWNWFKNQDADSTRILPLLDRMETEFQRQDEIVLARETGYLKKYYALNLYLYLEKGIDILDKANIEAHDRGWQLEEALLYTQKGMVLFSQGRQVPAFENMMLGYERKKAIGFNQIPNAYGFLLVIGMNYLKIGDYHSAIRFMREYL